MRLEVCKSVPVKSTIWIGRGKSIEADTARSNKRGMQALNSTGQVLGIFDRAHAVRNIERACLRYAAKLERRLVFLKMFAS